MPTIGHVAVGMAAGSLWDRSAPPGRCLKLMAGFAALGLAPDLDMIGYNLGVPYEHPFGHRGATHSLLLALVVAAVIALAGSRRPRLFLFAVVVAMSHGLLDALTTAGLGPALLWPLSEVRFFAPWRPLPATEGFVERFTTARGIIVTATETLIFSPLLLYGVYGWWRAISAAGSSPPGRPPARAG